MDPVLMILCGVGILVALFIVFIIARWQDIDWRCQKLRQYTKKNYIVLNIIDGDYKNYLSKIVNLDKDAIDIDGYTWGIEGNRIYRKDKDTSGFKVKKTDIKFGSQGAPNVFVSKEEIKPINLMPEEKMEVRPRGLSAILNALIEVELAKRLLKKDNIQMLVYIIIILLVINMGLSFLALGAASEARDMVKASGGQPASIAHPQNGSMVINQQPVR